MRFFNHSALLLGLSLSGIVASAQTQSQEKPRFGIRAGLTVASQQQAVGGVRIDNVQTTGYHVGLVAEVPLAGDLSFRPELLFSRKGMQNNVSVLGQSLSYTDKLSYLTVPLSLTYRLHAGSAGIVLGAGPYVAALLQAQREGAANVLGINLARTGKLAIGSDNQNDYKSLDAGLTFQGVVEFDRVFVGGHYGLGLANVLPAGDDNTYRRNRGWEFTVGVYLSN